MKDCLLWLHQTNMNWYLWPESQASPGLCCFIFMTAHVTPLLCECGCWVFASPNSECFRTGRWLGSTPWRSQRESPLPFPLTGSPASSTTLSTNTVRVSPAAPPATKTGDSPITPTVLTFFRFETNKEAFYWNPDADHHSSVSIAPLKTFRVTRKILKGPIGTFAPFVIHFLLSLHLGLFSEECNLTSTDLWVRQA